MSLLAVDIGNSRIKCAYINENDVANFTSCSSIEEFIESVQSSEIDEIAICSVVPAKTKLIVEQLASICRVKPFIISHKSKFNLILKYKTPQNLGVDRICSSAGAYLFCKKNNLLSELSFIVTIDFGTATTINIIEAEGIFLGGVIAPGLTTMFNSLQNNTAQLPLITLNNYNEIIGDTTSSAIASGVLNSTVGLINSVLKDLTQKDPSKKIKLFITGGNAGSIKRFLKKDFIFDETLVLKGIKAIYDLNK